MIRMEPISKQETGGMMWERYSKQLGCLLEASRILQKLNERTESNDLIETDNYNN